MKDCRHVSFITALSVLRMDIEFVVIAVLLMIADGLTVRGPSGPLMAPLGSSVVLPCYVDELLQMEGLEVEWRRADSETLVHLFLDGKSRAEVQQQDYQDRAHFFTDQIQQGNFSLRLDNLTAKDEGKYHCKVYSQQDSGETVVQIKGVECLQVSGSSRSVSAYDGEDVTLNCSVDSHITPEHIEEVSWKRTDGDEEILVLLYQNNESFPHSSDEQYRDRVEFFTDEIPKGNLSLRLKRVRTEDTGVYVCQVFAGGLSDSATVILEQLGFSSWHITVLVFCFAAGLGAVLLLICLIYCRLNDTFSSSTICNLQVGLVFCPNICMSIAFIFWGLTGGFLHETIPCCALYILRPVMLIWALPYLKYLQDSIKTWTRSFTITSEYAAFTVIVYSVLFTYGWRKRARDTSVTPCVASGILFGFVVLSCLILSGCTFNLRPSSQEQPRVSPRHKQTPLDYFSLYFLVVSGFELFLLITSFGYFSTELLILVFIQQILLTFIPLLPVLQTMFKSLRRRWIMLLRIIITPLHIILVIYIHLAILETEKDYSGWACVIVFLEVLRMIVFYENRVTVFTTAQTPDSRWQHHIGTLAASITTVEESKDAECLRDQRRQQQTEASKQGSKALHVCNAIMFMFGAVGLVLLSSVTLTGELIQKARNGERVLKDLRVIVFPSESVFALYWLVLQMHAY